MSTVLRNGALITEVRTRLHAALAAGQPPPTRRALARDLEVTEHAARRALEEATRHLTQPAPTSPSSSPSPPTQSPTSPTGRPDLTQPHPLAHPLGETTHPNPTHTPPNPTLNPPGLTQVGDLGETGRPPATHPHPPSHPLGDDGRTAGDPPPHTTAPGRTRVARWPLLLLALPAFVAIWGGWVGLGQLAGFGVIQLLPGIWDDLTINTAVTLPIGLETYAAYALHVALSGRAPTQLARRFAQWSAVGALTLGAGGQVAYHLMTAAHLTRAPWGIVAAVAVLPVVVLGMGAALAHLIHPSHPAHPPGDTQVTQLTHRVTPKSPRLTQWVTMDEMWARRVWCWVTSGMLVTLLSAMTGWLLHPAAGVVAGVAAAVAIGLNLERMIERKPKVTTPPDPDETPEEMNERMQREVEEEAAQEEAERNK